MRGTAARIACVSAAIALAGPAAAQAVVIGETNTPSPLACFAVASGFNEPSTYVQAAEGLTPIYAAPFDGVITSWSHQANATPGTNQLKLKVLRSGVDPGTYIVVASSAAPVTTPDELNTYGVRIPVQDGDTIGLTTLAAGFGCRFDGGVGDVVSADFDADPDPGDSIQTQADFPEERLNVSARLEPDADGDGFGDETQDGCPSEPLSQLPCPAVVPAAPDTFIKKRPPNKVKGRRVTYKFAADVEGATFECKLDRRPYRSCVSPKNLRVKPGRHKFRVRASASGLVDATPAADRFRVAG
jgi:hypothetical protein